VVSAGTRRIQLTQSRRIYSTDSSTASVKRARPRAPLRHGNKQQPTLEGHHAVNLAAISRLNLPTTYRSTAFQIEQTGRDACARRDAQHSTTHDAKFARHGGRAAPAALTRQQLRTILSGLKSLISQNVLGCLSHRFRVTFVPTPNVLDAITMSNSVLPLRKRVCWRRSQGTRVTQKHSSNARSSRDRTV
jgi:hypothetical protein